MEFAGRQCVACGFRHSLEHYSVRYRPQPRRRTETSSESCYQDLDSASCGFSRMYAPENELSHTDRTKSDFYVFRRRFAAIACISVFYAFLTFMYHIIRYLCTQKVAKALEPVLHKSFRLVL